MQLYIGALSGTSMDGVSVALVDFSGATPDILGALCQAYPADLLAELKSLCLPGVDELNRVGEADRYVAEVFSEAIHTLLQSVNIAPHQVKAIGSHGQNIRHHPNAARPFSWQIGDPNTLAARTGITTVADFRRRDIALGGQGAPLTPVFHQALLRVASEDRIVLNLGGIANVSVLPAESTQGVEGFDTGPGNGLLDAWIYNHQGCEYDAGGQWAASGCVHEPLLQQLLGDAYFHLPTPKSTGKEYFNLGWLQNYLQLFQGAIAPEDVQATLVELTARVCANAIRGTGLKGTLIICGGGAYNPVLVERIRVHCQPWRVTTSEEFGVAPEWVEAVAFAWFARETLAGRALDLSAITGAKRAVLLGGVYGV
jgi:anhydro-N-acetylmuramic acid kinase